MMQKPHLQIVQLQHENNRLKITIDQYKQEIKHLKNVNMQQQKQIQYLLNFNQRLLAIIEEETNNNHNQVNVKSLQPISQVTQNDSQVIDQMMQSLQKTRQKLAAKSQKGNPQLSVFEKRNSNKTQNNKVYQYLNQVKDLERSERCIKTEKQYSENGNKSSFSRKQQNTGLTCSSKIDYVAQNELNNDADPLMDIQVGSNAILQTTSTPTDNVPGYQEHQQKKIDDQEYDKIQQNIVSKINWQLEEIKKNAQMNHQFLDQKINQLSSLSEQITFNPEKKFSEIQKKIKLSPQIAAIVKKVMVKK